MVGTGRGDGEGRDSGACIPLALPAIAGEGDTSKRDKPTVHPRGRVHTQGQPAPHQPAELRRTDST